MQARKKTLDAMTRHYRDVGRVRVASAADMLPPPPPGAADPSANHHVKRAIPEGHKYDPKSLKPLAKMLWAMSVSLGHALTAHRQFTRLKSSTVSPDGMIGGRGYVMSVKDVRKDLYDACERLSAISDTIHDELNAPHWKPRIGELEKEDREGIERFVGEAERLLDNPEGDIEDEEEDVEQRGAEWHHPAVLKNDKKQPTKSEIPGAGDKETIPSQGPHPAGKEHPGNRKEASASTPAHRVAMRFLRGNSSLPVETLPGGPRVDHLDRGDTDQTGPYGSYNRDEPFDPQDDWAKDEGVGGDYNYPSDWDNNLSVKSACESISLTPEGGALGTASFRDEDVVAGLPAFMQRLFATVEKLSTSIVPDANSDPTPTQGWDFGIGDGNGNDAHGQGAGGYGLANPGSPGDGSYGVYGPRAELPKDPGAPVHDDESDSNPTIEKAVGGGPLPEKGASHSQECSLLMYDDAWSVTAATELPQDVYPRDVARADYYQGSKTDNMQNTTVGGSSEDRSVMPGEQMPAKDTPLTPRPAHLEEHMFGTAFLPGDPSDTAMFDKDIGPEVGYRYERLNQPYIKWDDTTHEMRPDPVYQREVEGPYVKPETVRPSDG